VDRNGNAAPPLLADRSFWAVSATQFLGAFNDNVYKQLLLLLFVKVPLPDGSTRDQQSLALLMFSLPFVLFSGLGGYLSDRHSKKRVMATCKFAEVVIMLLAVTAFVAWGSYGLQGWIIAAFCVLLFGMGTHSAFFGPGKFGILPELFRADDLPRANGAVLSSTFIAIILGGGLAGILMEQLGNKLWIGGLVCVLIAMLGSISVLLIRPTPPTAPGLRFEPQMLAIPAEICDLLRQDRPLYRSVVVSSVFWLSAAIVQPAIIALGKLQLEARDIATSVLVTVVSGGIAAGSILAGVASVGRRSLTIQRIGAWGMVITLAAMSIPLGSQRHLLGYWGSLAALTALGIFTGMFAVPLQVFMQSRPPNGQKGRMIATQNLLNWIGIFLSTGIYFVANRIFESLGWPPNAMFGVTAIIMLPIAIAFRPIMPSGTREATESTPPDISSPS
jgi:acyl-[acyl-carrier-protein]-phospholipid O-acyltransferase/long-chain-fatty-acid--[acyl-carrier-protein] ligase